MWRMIEFICHDFGERKNYIWQIDIAILGPFTLLLTLKEWRQSWTIPNLLRNYVFIFLSIWVNLKKKWRLTWDCKCFVFIAQQMSFVNVFCCLFELKIHAKSILRCCLVVGVLSNMLKGSIGKNKSKCKTNKYWSHPVHKWHRSSIG